MCMRTILLLCFFIGIKSITGMPSFEDFLKNIDFEKLEKDVEIMMKKNPALFDSIANSIPGGIPSPKPEPKNNIPPAQIKETKVKEIALVSQTKQDPRSLFLDPLSDKEKIDPNIHVDIPKSKLESFEFHRKCFILELKKLELTIDQSPFFSIECKEKLIFHKAGIDAIVIDLECIASRSFYKRIFFAKENGPLRQAMLTSFDQLRELNKNIAHNLENTTTLKTVIQEINTLQSRAREELEEPLKGLDPELPSTKKQKQFHRGKKLPRSQQ